MNDALTRALDLTNDHLQGLLENLQVGILACDADGQILVFNHLIREPHVIPYTSLSVEDWAEAFAFYSPDGLTRMGPDASPLLKAFRGETLQNYEYCVQGRAGDIRHRRAYGGPVFDRNGEKAGAVVVLHDITEQRRAEDALLRQAHFDPLTGLPNRKLLIERLDGLLAEKPHDLGSVAVMFLDLDHFKVVNDGHGHAMGDALLTHVALRFAATLREGDIVARLGGDEFVVLTQAYPSDADVIHLAQRLRASLDSPVILGDIDVKTSASIGIAFRRHELDTAHTLLRDADTAMYLAKEKGRDRQEVFGEELRGRAVKRERAHRALARAFSENRLRVFAQPILAPNSFAVVGVETLVRYQDPQLGLIAPSEFLPAAEEMGLIGRIDSWMLEQACVLANNWTKAFPGQNLSVSCNLSARSLAKADLLEFVLGCLERHQVAPSTLCLELTETSLISATPATIRALESLRAAGVHLGLDDFGTGYSSLTYLRDFPISFVKVDRSFVSRLGEDRSSGAIIDAVVRLAHALELSVTAEGVETVAQARALASLGCDHLQGYWISRPCPLPEIQSLIEVGLSNQRSEFQAPLG